MNVSIPFGFQTYRSELPVDATTLPVALGVTAALGVFLIRHLLATDNTQIKKLRGWPLVGQWSFFTKSVKRGMVGALYSLTHGLYLTCKSLDFIMNGFHQTANEPMFGFNILQHNIVAVRGEEARKVFFDRRDLSFTEGYRLLFGNGPNAKDVVEDVADLDDQGQVSVFGRRLSSILRMHRLTALTPLFMSDLERNMSKWGSSGKFDPFDDIYSMVFQLTVRAAACREIADSIDDCKRMEELYWQVEQGSTPTSTLFPWFPSPARILKIKATVQIYCWFDAIIKARKEENRREEDTLQVLMDAGDSTADIIQFVLKTLFAGVVNSGLMSAWIFIYLDQEPEWKGKVVAELQSLLNKYSPASDQFSSAAERLSCIPSEAWEGEMPVLEAKLPERNYSPFLRRVIKGDLDLGGKKIPNGSFLVYLITETHNNPDIYPDPAKFNPSRFSEGQDKSQYHAFLGWGVGRHPCLGRRFAQYEIKAICALFLSQYHYEVVNSKGVRPHPSTVVPDRNNLYQVRPKDFYIKYTRREEAL
ncbi:cytochrome P450 family protein [Ceratobasidium sp. AG-Ba]|nr:cytochrome P450 family protein [Ceratobasidium sp. AG-Ba]